ncbi:MAG: hypothetical protein Q7W02_15115 [Candidatus Rokubacteria bacterium]|nr:hypothetical protein [Candidatus Rokubacteria bacterium]
MQRGFGLISVLISLLIVSALTGVILQGYFQATVGPLTRDLSGESVRPDQGARLAEAQGLLTRTIVALTLCAQAKGLAGRSCSFAEVAGNAGVGPTGQSADGRWQITVAHLSTSAAGSVPVGQVSVAGVGGNAKGLSASLFATPDGSITRCDASGGPPPSSPSLGQGC